MPTSGMSLESCSFAGGFCYTSPQSNVHFHHLQTQNANQEMIPLAKKKTYECNLSGMK